MVEDSKGPTEQPEFQSELLLERKKSQGPQIPDTTAKTILDVGARGFFGTIAGYMSGRFCHQISDVAIFYTGLSMIFVAGLAWMEWVTINWINIDHDLLNLYHYVRKNAEEISRTERFKKFMLRASPLLLGFSGGFRLGFFGQKDDDKK